MASDADNDWKDPVVVDAHAQAGWAYDFFYKRFGRKSLDDKDGRVLVITHPVNRSDLSFYISTGVIDDVLDYYVNAFYAGGRSGIFVFGEGLPAGWRVGGQSYNYLAGGLDIVAHEYTHGVTDFSSALGRTGEPKSLNEAFSDMMAVAADFYLRPGRANYTIGEEVISGGLRSLADPAALGGVDHYSKRKPAGYEYDNSGIPSHAFYLAIEGGTNRTSGRAVQGVGAANREQIEKCFYRGFTSLISQATFSMARARTIESATLLYGAGSAPERAITQAWDAVGVF
jgi:thermolysin